MLFEAVSVVVPVYGSQGTLRELHRRLSETLASEAVDHEILFVEDAGRDRSWEVIQEIAGGDPRVRGIRLSRNFGQHNALLCGIRAARYGIVVTLDDDLQHPPEEIPKLLACLGRGADVVYGRPRNLRHSFMRNLVSSGSKRVLSHAMGAKNILYISAFRAFRTDLRDAFANYDSPSLVLDVLLSWGTTRFEAVEVNHESRQIGKSNYTFIKLVNQALLVLTGFSTAPLRAASLVGFTFTLFGFGVLIYVLTMYFFRGTLPGFAFIASIISLFGGAQLFAIGIIGEYLARIFHRSMNRPVYVVRELARFGSADSTTIGASPFRTDVELGPLSLDCAERMYRWMCDPVVSEGIGLLREPSLESTQKWLQETLAGETRHAFAINQGGAHVGNVVLDCFDPGAGSARVSMYVGEKAARNCGIGKAAMFQVLPLGFGKLGLRMIWLTVFPDNQAGMRIYTAAGFVTSSEHAPGIQPEGRPEGTLVMRLDKSQFESRARESTYGGAGDGR